MWLGLKKRLVQWFGFAGERPAGPLEGLRELPEGASLKIQLARPGEDFRLVVVSDTHLENPARLPPGEVLVHCGDFLHWSAEEHEIDSFNEWLAAQPFEHKVITLGNHEVLLDGWSEEKVRRAIPAATHVLLGSSAEIRGVNFYGAPFTHARNRLYRAGAFSMRLGQLEDAWARIPSDTDVLVTHIPPLGIRDLTYADVYSGSSSLLARIRELEVPLHLFGHNHDQTGASLLGQTLFVNAAQRLSDLGPFVVQVEFTG